jgi:putative transcriptional regulator
MRRDRGRSRSGGQAEARHARGGLTRAARRCGLRAALALAGQCANISGMGRGRMAVEHDGGEGYLTGQLLVAMPAMRDPRFAQTVVFMCAHTADSAMGIVINRPLEGLSFDGLLGQLKVEPSPPARRIRMHAGGPVETGKGFVLHTTDWVQEGSLQVDDRFALSSSIDVLRAIARGEGPRQGILALGYAGWGAGQLDEEILQNAWLSVHAEEEFVFAGDMSAMWRGALSMLKVDPLLLSGAAGRA